ncbi:MAG: hypothetical protein A3F74_00360 [Betaproteobacteria bacterium RIFCSPLOWO2_12_FULL_62_58]|nr:MAG: hypothetical protein A3F74_00360 [Betaproteobacteria bacterium RIFCSPLOWO2_12_FULL_62_58]
MRVRVQDKTLRGDYFDARLRESLSIGVCPACRELIDSENDYFSFLLVETYRVRKIQEEIAAALGFCMKHGARLKQFAEKPYQITFLSSALVHDILDQLRTFVRNGRGKRRSALIMPHPCPACKLGEGVAATKISVLGKLLQQPDDAVLYGHPGLLCFPHFQSLLPYLGPALFERLLTMHQRTLERTKDALDTMPTTSATYPSLDASWRITETLRAALTAAAGSEEGLPVWPALETPDGKRVQRNPVNEFAADLKRDDICPICLEIRRAWREWMTWLEGATAQNEILEDVLPTCTDHVWAGARVSNPRCAVAIARNVVEIELGRIHFGQALMSEARSTGRQRLSERLQSWFRGAHYRLAMARGGVALPIPCPVCRRLDAARDRVLELLFALLQEHRHRIAFENGYGLCLKHLSRALALQPPQTIQRILIECESAKLSRLEWELEEALHKWTWPARAEAQGTEQTAWRQAVSRLSGSFKATDLPQLS